jgi:hypothetical protein
LGVYLFNEFENHYRATNISGGNCIISSVSARNYIYTELFRHVVADSFEVTTSTFDFASLRATELTILQVIAFGVGSELVILLLILDALNSGKHLAVIGSMP